MKRSILNAATILLAVGCGNGSVDRDVNTVTVAANTAGSETKTDADAVRTVKAQSPVTITYRIIGTPVVGQPVGIDLQVQSTLGAREITLSYRVNDTTAMQFTEAQPARVSIAPTNDVEPSLQQVRVIPMREGRLFLNVSASVEGQDALMSSVTAIPIEVGAQPRVIQDNGEVTVDENGERLRSLPVQED